MRPKGQIFDLKSFRADHNNVSQKDVANAVGVKPSFLSAIENGKRSAPQSLLDALSKIYNEPDIDQYLHDRNEVENNISDINDSVINSPYSNVVLTDRGSTGAPIGLSQPAMANNVIPLSTSETSNENNSSNQAILNLTTVIVGLQQKINELEKMIKERDSYIEKLIKLIPQTKQPNQ